MNKLAFLALVALAIVICSCGNTPNGSLITTGSGSTNWEATLTDGTGQASLLDFVVAFSVDQGGGALSISQVNFINAGACFPAGKNASGNAKLVTNSSDQVTGTLSLTVTSQTTPTTLTMTGNVTGTSNGTTTSGGFLGNGVVQGSWTLSSTDPNCQQGVTSSPTAQGTFLMCEAEATCTPTTD